MKCRIFICAYLTLQLLGPLDAHASDAAFCELPYDKQSFKEVVLEAAFPDPSATASFRFPRWTTGGVRAPEVKLLRSAEYTVMQAVFNMTRHFVYNYFDSVILKRLHDNIEAAPKATYNVLVVSKKGRGLAASDKSFVGLNQQLSDEAISFVSGETSCMMAVAPAPGKGISEGYEIKSAQEIGVVDTVTAARFRQLTGCAAKSLLYSIGYENAVSLPDDLVISAVDQRGKIFPKSMNGMFMGLLEMAVLLADRSAAMTYPQAAVAITEIIEKECE